MFSIPIASATSAHLLGGVFAAVLVGPFAGFFVVYSVLITQSLFFSDRGFLALGANIFNMAFIGSFLSFYVYRIVKKFNYVLAVFVACFFSVMGACLSCLMELDFSNALRLSGAFKYIMGMHSGVSFFETIITLILIQLFRKLYGEYK